MMFLGMRREMWYTVGGKKCAKIVTSSGSIWIKNKVLPLFLDVSLPFWCTLPVWLDYMIMSWLYDCYRFLLDTVYHRSSNMFGWNTNHTISPGCSHIVFYLTSQQRTANQMQNWEWWPVVLELELCPGCTVRQRHSKDWQIIWFCPIFGIFSRIF